MDRKVVYVDGGIGRVLCAEPAINRLALAGNKVSVITPWTEVFKNHPQIKDVHLTSSPRLWADVIRRSEYLAPEPYNNFYYYNEEHHLCQSFDYLINGSTGEVTPPSIYLTAEETIGAKKILTEILQSQPSAAFIVTLQAFGASSELVNVNLSVGMPREEKRFSSEYFRMARDSNRLECIDGTNRSLPVRAVDQILGMLHPNAVVLNFSGIKYEHPRLINLDVDLRKWFALVSLSDYFIGIDSVGQHIAAAFGVPGHVFFGGTSPKNLAYPGIHTIMEREDFSREYIPYRQNVCHSKNDKAMEFDEKTIASVCENINLCLAGE